MQKGKLKMYLKCNKRRNNKMLQPEKCSRLGRKSTSGGKSLLQSTALVWTTDLQVVL